MPASTFRFVSRARSDSSERGCGLVCQVARRSHVVLPSSSSEVLPYASAVLTAKLLVLSVGANARTSIARHHKLAAVASVTVSSRRSQARSNARRRTTVTTLSGRVQRASQGLIRSCPLHLVGCSCHWIRGRVVLQSIGRRQRHARPVLCMPLRALLAPSLKRRKRRGAR